MQTKSFQKYIEKRLTKSDLVQIKRQAELEKQVLLTLKNEIALAIKEYMQIEEIGFNELVRRLDMSASQVIKIQNKEANLTLATVAHIFALLNKHPHFVFNDSRI